jgi:hypothetical protein
MVLSSANVQLHRDSTHDLLGLYVALNEMELHGFLGRFVVHGKLQADHVMVAARGFGS